ncbi:hypothetical protein KO506_06840 [Polaribacter vadi]|uniref:hypothetical protein n=1 Tax=Polaribacter TaxID=52959 RepID=UPI001C08A7A6|nr:MULTISPECIES: hypothetical protein [Polaribacter]MBU3011112.1 hypothetical protein [Polaribacter vadi]MDO6740926.1 hypothetical protein [Polaribacter sp. 1_MG-2023]
MKKVISVTVNNSLEMDQNERTTEFKEINEHLEKGWVIDSTETINSNTISNFTVLYTLRDQNVK